MKKILLLSIFVLFVISAFGGWVLPASLKAPASYEKIDRKVIAEYESQMGIGPITYRSGMYTSLREYAGSFSNVLNIGTILIYKTNEGNYGKLKILGYAFYHAWSRLRGAAYCDVPFFIFTTYNNEGNVLISGGYPFIIDQQVYTLSRGKIGQILQGVAPESLRSQSWEIKIWDYDERPQGASFMWFYFDFDTNRTSFYETYENWQFTGADVSNDKSITNSKLYPMNGAKFLVVFKP